MADPWAKLVAEVLLQRTQADRVSKVFMKLMDQYPDPAALAGADPDVVEELLWELGLRKRTEALISLARAVSDEGVIPRHYEELVRLPGVGDYTAAAWLCFSQGSSHLLLDANIARFVHRLLGVDWVAQAHRKAWVRRVTEAIEGHEPSAEFLYALLDFTRGVCRRTPECDGCPLGEGDCRCRATT